MPDLLEQMARRVADALRADGENFDVRSVVVSLRGDFGGSAFYISRRGNSRGRNEAIVRAVHAGQSRAEVARDFGITERHVGNILKKFSG